MRLAAAAVGISLVVTACVGATVVASPGGTAHTAPSPPPVAADAAVGGASDPSLGSVAGHRQPEGDAGRVASPARRRLVIHATGDVSVDPSYIPAFETHGYQHALDGMGGMFQADSLTIINLECPVTELQDPVDKTYVFRCDPAALPALRTGGVDVANLGNNHSLDHGPEALLDSIAQLERRGIAPVGAGADAAAAAAPALFEIGGWKVAVVGFGGVVPSRGWIAAEDRPGIADGDTIETMVAAVQAADAVADLVFVTIHWGVELDTSPRADDIARAEAMIAAGADAIFGHHSHRLNPMSFVQGRPVAWGLGNFVWPRLSVAGATTAVARVVVEPHGAISACLIPAEIESSGHPVLLQPLPAGCPPP